jgi:hypothetical protein
MTLAYGNPGALGDWRPLFALVAGYAAVVVGLIFAGKRREGYGATYLLPRISDGLTRLTGLPGWVAASVGTASFGLLVAGMGFYNDVAWHVRLGRDRNLFTAPHTAIVVGLFFIFAAAVVGTVMARVDGAEVGFEIRGVRVPWSMLALGLLGGSALSGFPLDDLWHHFYGIDVTMWSPTHLLMILGASFSPLASWLALSEGGVRPRDGAWAKGIYVAVAVMTLLGLSSAQGEFSFGVPQFQQLYHPVLILVAAGMALTATRLVIGPWWALVVAGITFGIGTGNFLGRTQESRTSAIYITCAVAVELAAVAFGTDKRVRFAIASGVGLVTIGLAGEWAWNQGAYQRWTPALLPDAVILGAIAAVGAAVVGTAFGGAVRRERAMGAVAVGLAGLAVVFCLAWPLPRTNLDATVQTHLTSAPGGTVVVAARVTPANAVASARWFQVMAWQGGGFVDADMKQVAPGVYTSSKAVPVGGRWKTVLRVQKGTAMASVPIWFPRDPAIGKPEIPAADRTMHFALEQRYLLREQHGGAAWFATVVFALLGVIALMWIGSLTLAALRVSAPFEPEEPTRLGRRPALRKSA